MFAIVTGRSKGETEKSGRSVWRSDEEAVFLVTSPPLTHVRRLRPAGSKPSPGALVGAPSGLEERRFGARRATAISPRAMASSPGWGYLSPRPSAAHAT